LAYCLRVFGVDDVYYWTVCTTGCVHGDEVTCDPAVSYIHTVIEGSICQSVLLDSLLTVKAQLSLYNYASWPSNCGGTCGVVVTIRITFLVPSQARPSGLIISLYQLIRASLGAK